MTKIIRFLHRGIITILIFSWTISAQAVSIKGDSLRFEVLLTSKMIKDLKLTKALINSIDITPNRLVLLSTADQFYLLGWGGIKPYGKKVTGSISSFAYTADSILMTIRNKELCSFDSTGNLIKLYNLPKEGMGIVSAGKYVMYLYDKNKDTTKHALYVLAKGGMYAKIFEIHEQINSVAEMNKSLFFASGKVLYGYDIKNKKLKVLAALSGDQDIRSITTSDSTNSIFFSTESTVYAYKDSAVVKITEQFGGILKFFDHGLIIFNPEKQYLIRISGLEEHNVSKIKEAAEEKIIYKEILTNAIIIRMVQEKFTDEQIIKIINGSNVNFDMGVDAMIALSKQNVSSDVIIAMDNRSKKMKH
jgi:hypothetical protein